MSHALSDADLAIIFREARSFGSWQNRPVSKAMLQAVYELMALGPTAMNSCPARVHFVVSREAKERLKPHLSEGNVAKTMAAPTTAILAYDMAFYEEMPKLFPARPQARDNIKANSNIETFVFRNATLQAGYFIVAARSLGLDCGPMSGFKNAGVDEAFFAGTQIKSNILCNLGYGDREGLFPRNPRLPFDDACAIL